MKTKADPGHLAYFGGPALFAQPRHVNKPNAAPRALFESYFDTAWQGNWFTNDGPLLQQFEARLRDDLGVADCVVMTNATAALQLVIQALDLSGEVIVPSYTFVSTANVLRVAGLTPVFCDIAEPDMNIDPIDCAARITERTSAVIATHVWSTPCDIDQLQQICDRAGIALVFDAAHAFGAHYHGRRIGGFGRAEIFSLHATKALHAFEGGVVATDDRALAADLRLRRNFGFSAADRIDMPGVNAKMSEAHAAMGLANLDVFADTVARNRRCHDTYASGLDGLAGLHLCRPQPGAVSNWHYAVLRVDPVAFGMDRDTLAGLLWAENVWARKYFSPGGHRMTPHLPNDPDQMPVLPVTESVCDSVLVLPAGAAIAIEDVAAICDLIRFIAGNAGRIIAAQGANS